jgi:signal transduction histidine kinase
VQLQADELADGNLGEANRYQQIIADEIQRLDGILGSFQDFTRPLSLNRELRSINEIVQRTVSMARMEDLGIELETDLAPRIPDLEVDPAFLRQVFINLILNASEACGQDGVLSISTKLASPWVVIDFRDNGPGIPRELRSRIFEPFYSTKAEGSGVGLSICSRIIDAHDGKIEVAGGSDNGGHLRISLRVAQ